MLMWEKIPGFPHTSGNIYFVINYVISKVWCSSYNCVLYKILIPLQAFLLSSFIDHAWKGSLRTWLEYLLKKVILGYTNLIFVARAK